MMCKRRTYIKGVCDKCPHYVTECDPIVKTKFKEAQVVFNNYIFDEVRNLNEFRANEEALIKQRVTKLENAWESMQAQLTRNTIKMGDIIDTIKSLEKGIDTINNGLCKLESQALALDKKHGVGGCFDRNTVGWIGEFKPRIEELEAAIVALQLKLDSLNLKVDYPVEKQVHTFPTKGKAGRPKKV